MKNKFSLYRSIYWGKIIRKNGFTPFFFLRKQGRISLLLVPPGERGIIVSGEKEVGKILKNLYLISGFRVSLHDTSFNETAAYPEDISGFCELVQQNPKAKMQCLFTDSDAFERVRHSGKVYLYKCRFGLYEAACPLFRNGVLAGYLMMGQALEDSENAEKNAFAEALPYVGKEEELKKRLAALPTVSAEKMRAFADIITLCAERLTDSALLGVPPAADLAAAAVRYINRNIGRKLTIGDICAAFNCSKSTLMKLFKKECGVTVNEYIVSRRIAIAKELLQYTELSVGTIAEKCGFSDSLYFSKCFTSRAGVSPSAFRKNPFGKR